ncbi:MAG: NAD(P)H-dependent oxidoreductase subunit E, partial [Treponema sp.]|nr:NAD(P)H-dependent oxidoreductase subunit E [Treponema sp.]
MFFYCRLSRMGKKYYQREVDEVNTQFDGGVVDDVIKTWGAKPGSIIPILQGVQEKYNYLP